MTWHTGTATDFKDLLLKIKNNAVADGWVVKSYTTGGSSPHTDQLIIQGPGFGSGFEVYAEIRSYEDAVNSVYAFECRGIAGYASGIAFEFQPSVSPPVYTNLWNGSISYWMSITDRRILVIAKVSATYHSIYLGFIDPFSSPIEYPYPMYVASDAPTPSPYGNTDAYTRSIAAPGLQAAYFREPGGTWRIVAVYAEGAGGNTTQYDPARYTIWPYGTPKVGASYYAPYAPTSVKFTSIPGNADTLPMFPTYMTPMFNAGGILGVLEGVYWIPGFGMSAEQTITIGSDTYMVFIDISRAIEQPTSFYAVKVL